MDYRFLDTIVARGQSVSESALRQVSFPTPLRAVIEMLMFAGVFVASSRISLGIGWQDTGEPMVPILLGIMLANVISGVYRRDSTHSILKLYLRSLYGFLLSSIGFIYVVIAFYPQLNDNKFIFFFLFFSFFVSNTVRPLISGTDFMDGGGRRTN